MADDELIGRTIAGRYRIISRIRAGGMGVAYRAWDHRDGRPVAIKTPKSSAMDDPSFVERFGQETRIMDRLRHPHIVPIVDVGWHGPRPFFAMRYLPGGSLLNRRLRHRDGRARQMHPSTLHLWLQAVSSALDFIHESGVVHRDVKPANIFFDGYWHAYLGDYGVAKILQAPNDLEEQVTEVGMVPGTEAYIAPELLHRARNRLTSKFDGRVDQYSLAVIVYEFVAAVRPFTGERDHIYVEVLKLPVPDIRRHRSNLPDSFCDALHRSLSKNPEHRFATCSEFTASLLRDIPEMHDKAGLARLLCPGCENILTLDDDAAGRQGRCPRCKREMMVASDLGALWLVDEAPHTRQEETGFTVISVDSSPMAAALPQAPAVPSPPHPTPVVPGDPRVAPAQIVELEAMPSFPEIRRSRPRYVRRRRSSSFDLTIVLYVVAVALAVVIAYAILGELFRR